MGNPTISDRVCAYEEWLRLIEHFIDRFGIEWPNNELRAYISYDQVEVLWELGTVGSIYRDKRLCVFSSNGRERLRGIEPEDANYVFHQEVRAYLGWQTDERVRSDIEYGFQNFWKIALNEARIAWRAQTVADDAMERLKLQKGS